MKTTLNVVTVKDGRVRFNELEVMRDCVDKLKISQWLLNLAEGIKTNSPYTTDCGCGPVKPILATAK